MHSQWVAPYVQTAMPGQEVLQAGWLVGQCADWRQTQLEAEPASALTEQAQNMWKAGFGSG
jgi:hypothetical protein